MSQATASPDLPPHAHGRKATWFELFFDLTAQLRRIESTACSTAQIDVQQQRVELAPGRGRILDR